ncbi:ribonucleoside-triphosphate reductase, adenosylcobalamin-dependent [Ligilactobacillus sp. LYQ60]|uniref:ribonucleoside-triphosphate reductase, adenosylcobalamin-dependent n=1 Tax=unclassified Ligilactobacillus TaxID=2767920 RepID=UPI003852EEED
MKRTIKLSQDFIMNIKENVHPHWGELGWVTYKRTYARWLPQKHRTEEWIETVQRVVEGNINLDPRLTNHPSKQVINELTDEAKQLFRLIYGLSATPSGRNLWISGTDYQQRTADSLNNCWFIAIRPQKYGDSHIVPSYLQKDQSAVSMPYSFMFDQLMKGGGVGFSVTHENVKQIPAVDYPVQVEFVIDKTSRSYDDALACGARDRDEWEQHDHDGDALIYKVPDTREGWVLANAQMIDLHFVDTNPTKQQRLILDVTDIRAKGTRIHGFGGTAAGPMPLITMIHDINELINQRVGQHLTAVDCTDIGNLIGKAVVAGNVRRSAELALGSNDDHDFITMKQDAEKLNHHRWASNNSVAVDSHFMQYQTIADSILHNGEPGVVNLELSRNYGRIVDGNQLGIDGDVEGTNPCGEVSLANGEPCNLFEVFPAIAEEQGWELSDVFRLAMRYTKRITFSNYDWEVSRKIISKNRRVGVSMSGIQDWILKRFGHRIVTGFEKITDSQTGMKIQKPIYDPKICATFNQLYQAVVSADQEYSAVLGCQESVKHTTVKPSGTVAKLAGASEGMHFHYAGYLIQRIRFQDSDPLLPAFRACGYRMEPDVYTEHTICVEFPVRAAHADAPEFVSSGNVTAAEQFATQAFLQTYWSDNAVSCTITFQPNEADQLAGLLTQYRNTIKSTSLLPYLGGEFKQAPKQPITKDVFEQRKAMLHGDVQEVFQKQNKQDIRDLEIVGQSDCESGACPIK